PPRRSDARARARAESGAGLARAGRSAAAPASRRSAGRRRPAPSPGRSVPPSPSAPSARRTRWWLRARRGRREERPASCDPLPEGPLHDCDAEEERADSDDRGVRARAAANRRECQEEREDRQPEARDREQRPALARHAQRDRKAERGEEAVGSAEAAP